MERFIKPRYSTRFSLDVPGPSITASGPYADFFNSAFVIWLGGKNLNDENCIKNRLYEVSRDIGDRVQDIIWNKSSV